MQEHKNKWSITTLYFHHVSPTINYYTNNPPDIFEQQIEALADNYKCWTVSEAYHAYLNGIDSTGHIVLTFDDGYKDNYQYARKILERYNLNTTFYILPLYVG